MDINTRYIHQGNESDIELHITENINDISKGCFWGDILQVQNQFCFPVNGNRKFCDLFIYHKDGTGTIVEVKKYRNLSEQVYAIGQILMYAELAKALLGNYPRLVIASDYIDPMINSIIKGQKLPIRTLQVDGDIVTYF